MRNSGTGYTDDRSEAGRGNICPPFQKYLVLFLTVFGCILALGLCVLWLRPDQGRDEAVSAPLVESIQKIQPPVIENKEPASVSEETALTSEEPVMEEDLPVTLTFGGDVLFDPGYAVMSKIKQRGGGIEGSVSSELLEILRSSDISVVNNEFPYSRRGFPTEGKTFTFRADPASAGLLTEMGVDLVTLANNHAYDYGPEALTDTFQALTDQGVTYIGAGVDSDEAWASARYEIRGSRISLLSATQIERLSNPDTREATSSSPGVFRCLDDKKLLARIREERDEGYFVIVCVHWGTENEEPIDWLQQKQAPELAEAGAGLIIGCHPHILQAVGKIGNTPVFYSLGNFLFNSKTLDSCLVRVEIKDGVLVGARLIPCIQQGSSVSMAGDGDKNRIISHFNQLSGGAYPDGEGFLIP